MCIYLKPTFHVELFKTQRQDKITFMLLAPDPVCSDCHEGAGQREGKVMSLGTAEKKKKNGALNTNKSPKIYDICDVLAAGQ